MGKYYRYYVLIIVTVASILNIADRLIMSILMEDIKAEFHLSDTQVGLLVGLAFALFYSLMSFPIARWADVGNRKNILSLALVIWSGMTALCGTAVGFFSLFFARLGVGVGEAGGSPPTYSIIADYFKPKERPRAMAVYVAGAALGTGGGLILGGWLGEMIGWRKTFMVLGIPGVLLGILLYFSVKEPERGRYDAGEKKDKQAVGIPATLKSLSSNTLYVRNALSFAMLTMIGYAMAFWLAPIMLRNFDVGTAKVGIYLGSTYIVGGLAGPIIGGLLTDRLVKSNARWLAWLPMLCSAAVMVALWFCVTAQTFNQFLGFFVIAYTVFMVPQGAAMSLLQTPVRPGERAMAVSLALMVITIIGAALGPFVVGVISDALAASHGTKSLNYALLILSLVGSVLGTMGFYWTSRAISDDLLVDTNHDNDAEVSQNS